MVAIIFVLVIIALVAVFSVQNAAPVTISFFFWKFEASLAIVVFLSVLSGIIITVVIISSGYIKRYIKTRGKKTDNLKLL